MLWLEGRGFNVRFMACMSRSASMLGLLVPGLRGFISFALLPSRSQMLNCCDMPSSDLTCVHICANVLSLALCCSFVLRLWQIMALLR